MAALTDNLRALRPDLNWGRGERMRGNQPLGYGEATAALEEIGDLDGLIDQLGQEHPGATLDDIDVESVSRSLGRQAADDVQRLQELERELRRQGWVHPRRRRADAEPEGAAPARAAPPCRRSSPTSPEAGAGQHDLRDAGAAGEVTGASRPWEYGDEQPLDVVRTARPGRSAGPASACRSRLHVEDFEVVETERRASAAVALCVDLSLLDGGRRAAGGR